MNENQIRVTIAMTGSAVVTTLAIRSVIKTHRQEAQKRLDIEKNKNLDLRAIKLAGDVMTTRIESGEIRSLGQLIETMNNEIAFQKIAVREDA